MALARKMEATCKHCHHRSAFDFTVNDALWNRVVPIRLRCKVVCLICFDRFAARKKIDYRRSIRVLYFAGSGACFRFIKRSKDRCT